MTNFYENRPTLFSPSLSISLLMLLSFTFFISALALLTPPKVLILEWTLNISSVNHLSLPILICPLSLLFTSTVTFISSNVLMFSKVYMNKDKNMLRFTHLVLLFILSMNILIFCPNLVALMLGWDGLGITSFLLVIFYQNNKSLASGMLTVLANRLGDICLLISISLILPQSHWNIFSMWPETLTPSLLLPVLILTAGMTKSAQVPFSSWLPAAMAAPTPVSALVHSSTLVTAGVFLLLRFYPFLSMYPIFNASLLTTGALTMYFGSLWALTNLDMKQVVALSTLSQLGLMMVSLSLGLTTLTLFHLISHAMFKALLFMTVGMAILAQKHRHFFMSTEMVSYSPSNGSALVLSLLSMNAFPFLAGFYSKDMILETIIFNPSNLFLMTIFVLSTAFTATYSIRLYRGNYYSELNTHSLTLHFSDNKPMLVPLTNMMVMTTVVGALLLWLLFNSPESPTLKFLHYLPMALAPSGAIFALISCRLSYKFCCWAPTIDIITASTTTDYKKTFIFRWMNKGSQVMKSKNSTLTMGGMKLLPSTLSYFFLKLTNMLYITLDHGWLELLGPKTLASLTQYNSTTLTTWTQSQPISLVMFSLLLSSLSLTLIL